MKDSSTAVKTYTEEEYYGTSFSLFMIVIRESGLGWS